MTLYVRVCPACSTERPLQEDDCQNVLPSGELCSFPLLDIHPTPAGDAPAAPVEPADPAEPQAREGAEATGRTAGEIEGHPGGSCPNGHPVEPDDDHPLRLDVLDPGSSAVGREVVDRHVDRLPAAQFVEVAGQQFGLERIRMVEVDPMPLFRR